MGVTRLSDLERPLSHCGACNGCGCEDLAQASICTQKIVVWLTGQGLACGRRSAHTCGERAAPWPGLAQGTTIPTIRRYILKYKLQTKFKRPRQNCLVFFLIDNHIYSLYLSILESNQPSLSTTIPNLTGFWGFGGFGALPSMSDV